MSEHTTTADPAAANQSAGPLTANRKCTDLGNAERLADRAEGQLLWVYGLGWLSWDGRRWASARTGEEVRAATAMVRSIYGEAARCAARAAGATDEVERERFSKAAKALNDWARRSEHAQRVGAALSLARSRETLVARAESLDADPDALNVANGILDLRTLETRRHDPAERHTKVARAAYVPGARSDRWERFLRTVLPSDEVRRYVQKGIGYSLLGRYSEHLFIPWGSGKNGKSTLLRAVRHALGDYAMEAAPELLIEKRGGRSAGDMSAAADLRGRRFVTTIETGEGKRLAETFVKQLTGEHIVKAKLMRRDWFEFENQTAIWLGTNHKPRVEGADTAIWERLHLIPFDVWVPPNERDEELGAKLERDRDAVLAWAVEGLRLYRDEGLEPPAEVSRATADYKEEMDPISEWLENSCEFDDPEACTPVKWIRSSYAQFCAGAHVEELPARRFNAALTDRGLTQGQARIDGHTRKVWRGLALTDRWQFEALERLSA